MGVTEDILWVNDRMKAWPGRLVGKELPAESPSTSPSEPRGHSHRCGVQAGEVDLEQVCLDRKRKAEFGLI